MIRQHKHSQKKLLTKRSQGVLSQLQNLLSPSPSSEVCDRGHVVDVTSQHAANPALAGRPGHRPAVVRDAEDDGRPERDRGGQQQ
eukprot:scaffold136546_cov133-Phaeocystis_antarctica.AAC.1